MQPNDLVAAKARHREWVEANKDNLIGEDEVVEAIRESRRDGAAKPQHRCEWPMIPVSLTVPQQPDWTCAACGRIWRDNIAGPVRWWAEVRGPTHFPRGETL